MTYSGILKKMSSSHTVPVTYFLELEQGTLCLNDLLNRKITITFTGEKYCIKCKTKVKKLYGEGFCYKCFITAPEADPCIIHPEKCRAHEGISRDMEWSKKNCLIDHYVYLALTDHIKVGVTRINQIPTRWIDQGAIKVIKLAKTPYRQLAGLIEVDLKKHFSDKTYWKRMLSPSTPNQNLLEAKQKAAMLLNPKFAQYIETDNSILSFNYPVLHWPEKIYSVNLDKTNSLSDILVGIKGQYLIFQSGAVLNVRKHTGYYINLIF